RHHWVLLHETNRPEIVGEIAAEQVFERHREISLQAPVLAPGIARHESLLRIVVPDGDDGVAADERFLGLRQLDASALCDRLALEALVDREAEDERIAAREASFQLQHFL